MSKKINKLSSKSKKQAKIALIVSGVIIIGSILGLYTIPTINNAIRKDRIVSIFNSLKIDDQKYTIKYDIVFGDKKSYSYDSGRSASSVKMYTRNANVDVTVAELKQAIAATDFKFYEEPYPGTADFMYIYKSPRNEYLRVSVSSKARTDDYFNRYNMGLSTDDITISPNAGPSNVTVKVNLDDNNE